MLFLFWNFFLTFSLFSQTYLQTGWEILNEQISWDTALPDEVKNPQNYKWKPISFSEEYECKDNKAYLLRIPIKDLSHYKNPHIFLPPGPQAWRIFWDGKEIYHYSSPKQFEPNEFLGWIFHIFPIEKKETSNSYIYLLFYTGPKVWILVPEIDEKEKIIYKLFTKNLTSLFSISIASFLGIIIFFISITRKFESFYFALSIFLLSVSVWLFLTNPISQLLLSFSSWKLKLEYFSLYLAPVGVLWFVETVLVSQLNKILIKLKYIIILYIFFSFTLDYWKIFPLWKTLYPFDVIIIIGAFLLTFQILNSAINGKWEAKLLAPGIISLLLCAIHDSLEILGFLSKDKQLISHFGILLFIVSMTSIAIYRIYLLNWHLRSIAEELHEKNIRLKIINEEKEELNQTLEIKVIERTQDLYQKMEEIKNLKIQQDADYYLTSILIKPLSRNNNKSKLYLTDMLTLQKKIFEFRSKKWELGGDIGIIENIYFQDFSNRYIFFFNADAMGKSMQGAGGAIVAGTTINYILNKANNSGFPIQKDPETWLNSLYLEINSMFQTFEGYMLVTATCGVLEENTGKLIWFNAEHTPSILFHKKAEFILGEKFSPKFGSKFNEFPEFNYYKLQEEETFLIGSDGKDEVEIFLPNGGLKWNQTEDFFLEIVNEAGTNLQKILEVLQTKANLEDDISLLSIYRNPSFFLDR